MNTFKVLIFVAAVLGSAAASRLSKGASAHRAPRFLDLTNDDHLCTPPTDVIFEYGTQTNQDGIKVDCDRLSQKLKTQADQLGNFTGLCTNNFGLGFWLFNTEGNCSLWFNCDASTEGFEVMMAYGDVADVIKLATDGLQDSGSGQSDNSSILSVSTSMGCQFLTADWIVAFNSSDSAPGA